MVIERERRGRVEILAINRPEARNAVNGDVAQGIEAALDDLEADDEAWAVVVTGRGPVFSPLLRQNWGAPAALPWTLTSWQRRKVKSMIIAFLPYFHMISLQLYLRMVIVLMINL